MKKYTASKMSPYVRVTVYAVSREEAIKMAVSRLGTRKGISVVCAG